VVQRDMSHTHSRMAKLQRAFAKDEENVMRIGVVTQNGGEIARFGAGPKRERKPSAVGGFGFSEGGRKAGAKKGELEEFSEEMEKEAAQKGIGR